MRNAALQRFRVFRDYVEECIAIFFFFIFFYIICFSLCILCKNLSIVYKDIIHFFDIWLSNLMDSCFLLSSFKNFIRFFFLPIHIKNMLSINLAVLFLVVFGCNLLQFSVLWSCLSVSFVQSFIAIDPPLSASLIMMSSLDCCSCNAFCQPTDKFE